jgi:DNA-binding NtrC family response regulator
MLIVTSRLADDRLWAEALNLGAYDVIAKPFDASEVVRIAGLACAHWNQRESGQAAVMHSVA